LQEKSRGVKLILVSDSGPLISLAKIGKFSLLKKIFGEVIIPEAVYQEVVEEGRGKAGEEEVRSAKWIEVKKIENHLAVRVLLSEIKKGEAESIVLADEVNADLLVMDDSDARHIAEKSGLDVIGTVGILITAGELGLIKDTVKAIDDLRDRGFYLKDEDYRWILKEL